MTIDDLCAVLKSCAGEPDGGLGGTDITDIPFEVLGYDSLALMETAARIGATYDVHIDDEQIVAFFTPREVLELVNGLLSSRAA